ncbi:Gluconate 5-dehydrogenase [Saliniradius amylolyticus]|uniref:Gluconate 5-dehydrogenase n=1 Tax=Saliniradius amylolyticus TaxID=2183582 RepID=A0A2S2E3Y9_9ALTE|nr:SDR family oxidoreductase [Saliniradius amylolyticus]AWL12378.1 Gluconate 5-dehydrogenase [Saliniradius amylolyticus]
MSQSKRVVITGGGSGLGQALAQQWSQAGARVCITDRNEADVKSVARQLEQQGGNVLALKADVTSEADWESVVAAVTEAWGGVDILINNAGVATAGALEAESIEQWQWILDINLLGIVRGCHAFGPLFRQQGSGQVINIASQAGVTPIPQMGSYNATKAAVVAFSETLRLEWIPAGLDVSVVCPSFFKTNLDKNMRTQQPELKTRVARLFAKASMTADDVAQVIIERAAKGQFMILPHREGRVAWYLKRFLPQGRYLRMMEKRLYRHR